MDAAAFAEDCRRAQIIVTPLIAPIDCEALLVIDAPKLERLGAHAVRISGREGDFAFSITTERSLFPRPWQAAGNSDADAGANISATGL
jgi:competence protein ComEC